MIVKILLCQILIYENENELKLCLLIKLKELKRSGL